MTRTIDIKKDYANNQLIIHKSQDVSDIIKGNLEDRNAGPNDLSFGRKVASVPLDVLDAWIKEGIDYRKIRKDPAMKKKFFEKLNSREWCAFKTYNGIIG